MSKVPIDDLPKGTLYDIIAYLADNTSWGDEEEIRNNLLDLGGWTSGPSGIHLPLKTVPLRSIRMGQWGISKAAIKKYAAMSPETAPPVLVIGNKLAEGGHRLRAAQARGDKNIQVVDIADLLRLNWKAFMNGAPLPPALRESSRARNLITQFIT